MGYLEVEVARRGRRSGSSARGLLCVAGGSSPLLIPFSFVDLLCFFQLNRGTRMG